MAKVEPAIESVVKRGREIRKENPQLSRARSEKQAARQILDERAKAWKDSA